MVRYLDLDITVVGPVLTKGAEPGDPGLDAVTLRAPDGSLVINGKHIHGRCRHAAQEIVDLSKDADLSQWIEGALGPDSTKDASERDQHNPERKPVRAAVSFEELRCFATKNRTTNERDFRLEKDELTEAGKDQMLAVFERAAEHGEPLHFVGKVRIVCSSEQDGKRHHAILLRALRWLTNIGGEIGVGYGGIQSVSLKPCETAPGAKVSPLEGVIPRTVDLELAFAEPFCLAKSQLDENIFLCLDFVPGNALAGAIKRALGDVDPQMERFEHLRRQFDVIRFRHAFPMPRCSKTRPIPSPLSWVSIGPKDAPTIFDAALIGEPALFKKDAVEVEYVPNFQPDWKGKDFAIVREASRWGRVEKELRMYTEIDRGTGVAMDERLYAYELVRPDRQLKNGEREKVTWQAAIDLPDEDRFAIVQELCALLNEAPLLFGKTDARCTVSMHAHPDGADLKPHEVDYTTDYWIVTLATDALLLDIEHLAGAGQPELELAYRDAWEEIGKQTLEQVRKCNPIPCESPIGLHHYFSQEKMVGGGYLHHRFRGAVEPYAPYLITGAGSVFVLSSKPESRKDVQDLFRKLLEKGLPLRDWVKKFTRSGKPGDDWRNCPFIPQNGYGEIVVNHQAQIDRLHSKQDIEPVPVKMVVCQ
jgi:hypothetical protein